MKKNNTNKKSVIIKLDPTSILYRGYVYINTNKFS